MAPSGRDPGLGRGHGPSGRCDPAGGRRSTADARGYREEPWGHRLVQRMQKVELMREALFNFGICVTSDHTAGSVSLSSAVAGGGLAGRFENHFPQEKGLRRGRRESNRK